MKKLAIFLFCVIFAYSSFAMDQNKRNERLLEQIKGQCEQYRIWLPKQYACVCTNFFHALFNSETKKEELSKIKHLDKVIKLIDEDDIDLFNIYKIIFKDMGSFNDEFGKRFRKSCHTAFALALEWPDCPICNDGFCSSIALPCGHTAACDNCFDTLKKNTTKIQCCLCKIGIEDVFSLTRIENRDKLCLACNKNKSNILNLECGHLVQCSDCKNVECPKCFKKSTKLVKIFINL